MSFLDKIKQGLGIDTLDAKLNVPGQIAGNSGQLEGDFNLTAKSNQQINEVLVKFEMVQHWDETKHNRDSKGNTHTYTAHESRTFELGNYCDRTPFEMKAGEVKTIHFAIPFQMIYRESPADEDIAKGGLSAVLGTIRKFTTNMRNIHFEYKVAGKVDLKDVALDPKDSIDIMVT